MVAFCALYTGVHAVPTTSSAQPSQLHLSADHTPSRHSRLPIRSAVSRKIPSGISEIHLHRDLAEIDRPRTQVRKIQVVAVRRESRRDRRAPSFHRLIRAHPRIHHSLRHHAAAMHAETFTGVGILRDPH